MTLDELTRWIDEERQRQKLSVENLAREVGVTLNSMARFLRGEMRFTSENLFSTVAALGFELAPTKPQSSEE